MFFSDSAQQVPAELGAGEPCELGSPPHPLVLGEFREAPNPRNLRVGTIVLTKGRRIRAVHVAPLATYETYVEHGETGVYVGFPGHTAKDNKHSEE